MTTCKAGKDLTVIADPAGDSVCTDMIYTIKATDRTHAAISKAMTKSWYDLKSNYDFALGKPKSTIKGKDATYDDVAGLTAMLWIGVVKDDPAATDFAAFAVKSGCAMARFCKTMNIPKDDAASYKKNVLKQCINAEGVDFCFTAD
jgi:hypothetical protein